MVPHVRDKEAETWGHQGQGGHTGWRVCVSLHLFPEDLLCSLLGLEQVTEASSLSEPCWETGLLRAGWESWKDHTGEVDGGGDRV